MNAITMMPAMIMMVCIKSVTDTDHMPPMYVYAITMSPLAIMAVLCGTPITVLITMPIATICAAIQPK